MTSLCGKFNISMKHAWKILSQHHRYENDCNISSLNKAQIQKEKHKEKTSFSFTVIPPSRGNIPRSGRPGKKEEILATLVMRLINLQQVYGLAFPPLYNSYKSYYMN